MKRPNSKDVDFQKLGGNGAFVGDYFQQRMNLYLVLWMI